MIIITASLPLSVAEQNGVLKIIYDYGDDNPKEATVFANEVGPSDAPRVFDASGNKFQVYFSPGMVKVMDRVSDQTFFDSVDDQNYNDGVWWIEDY